LKNPKKLFKM